MGIDLSDVVVKRPVALTDYAGKRIAFDAWNILYQFLASIRQPDGTPLMDKEGRVTSHLAGILYRTGNLVEAGIKPVFVFDGEPHPLKADTLAERSSRKLAAQGDLDQARAAIAQAVATGDAEAETRETERARTKAQQTSRLSIPMVEQAQELLRALGVPVVQAPGEGEAQASWMCTQGLVHAACSQDYDAILFGTPRLVRHMATGGRRKMPGKQVWTEVGPEEIALDASLQAAGLTREQLVDVALLVGTDFHPGIRGIGAKKAVALIKKEGDLESLLERLTANPASADSAVERAIIEQQAALVERDTVRRIFLEPAHTDSLGQDLELQPADAGAVRALMVQGHGFSADRVDTALEKFGAARKKGAQKTLF